MRLLICYSLLILSLNGCWQSRHIFYRDIINKPSAHWTENDCRSIIETHTEYNRYDRDAAFRVVATEYTPLVFMAINRADQRRTELNETQYVEHLNESMSRYLGLKIGGASDTIY